MQQSSVLNSQTNLRVIAENSSLHLAVARPGRGGLGAVVNSQQSKGLIAGVQIAPLALHPDDRGYFMELFRWGHGLAQHFGSEGTLQVSAALSYPGTIKAIHYHLRQTDLWHPAAGLFQVMLYDLRVGSPTFGQLNTIYAG